MEGLEASLERLQLKYVDVVYAHRPDRLTPMEETVRAYNYVIEKGQALYWGTSEWGADEIAEAVCRTSRLLALYLIPSYLQWLTSIYRSASQGTCV